MTKKRLDTVATRTNRLEELRGQMPVPECANRVGCERGSWYKWERGSGFPALPYLPRIEDLLSKINGKKIGYREVWPHLVIEPDKLEALG